MTFGRQNSRAAQDSAKGGLRAAANMTPQQRSERASNAARAGVAKRAAERAARGEPPARKRAPQPSANELQPWLDELDRRYPDRQWATGEERRREAVLLMRMAAAEAIAAAMKEADE